MQRLSCSRIPEGNEEERNVVLPWQTAVRGQVDFGRYVAIAVGGVGDGEFLEVGLVMDIPAAAKGRALIRDGGRLDRLDTYKITEQNPNSLLAALRNLALDMNFPRRTPSTSMPASQQDQFQDRWGENRSTYRQP